MTEIIEDSFPDHVLEVRIGGQKVYDYLVAIE
jgi:hypothetical protein